MVVARVTKIAPEKRVDSLIALTWRKLAAGRTGGGFETRYPLDINKERT